jgi:hypothetical protein
MTPLYPGAERSEQTPLSLMGTYRHTGWRTLTVKTKNPKGGVRHDLNVATDFSSFFSHFAFFSLTAANVRFTLK